MVDSIGIKVKMLEHGFTQRSLATVLGMNTNTLNSKINNKTSFTVEEASKLCELLHISAAPESVPFFFCRRRFINGTADFSGSAMLLESEKRHKKTARRKTSPGGDTRLGVSNG